MATSVSGAGNDGVMSASKAYQSMASKKQLA